MASSRHNGKNTSSRSAAASSADAGQDQAGEFLTTAQGLRLPDTDHSLRRASADRLCSRTSTFRHCKVLAAWGDGTAVLEAAGITAGGAGVITGDTAVKSFTDQLAAAGGLHRAWDRAPDVMASAIPPVLTS